MQGHKMQQARHAAVVPSLAAALVCAFSAGAWAQEEPSPYYIGITQALTHDSNIYGSPNAISDNYSSTGLRGGFDQTISRQRLYGSANVRYNKYQSETGLDNTSYGAAGGWDWATINQLSGTVAANANRSLASLDTTTGAQQNTNGEKNLVKTDQLSTSIMWGGAGALSLQGAYSHSRVNYSAASYAALASSANSASVSMFYRLGPDIKLGTALRYVRTESPNGFTPTTGASEPNTANIRNLDLTADWRVTAQSGVDARLSWTRQTNSNDNLSDLDFSGLTGMLSARYAATGKTSFIVSLSRDVGTNASFFNNPTTGAATSASTSYLTHNSQTTDTLSLGATYLATAKITMNALASYRRSKIVYDGGGAAVDGNDNISSVSLGADYAIARSWQLGCKLAHSSRNVSGSSSYSYAENSVGCSAQLTIR